MSPSPTSPLALRPQDYNALHQDLYVHDHAPRRQPTAQRKTEYSGHHLPRRDLTIMQTTFDLFADTESEQPRRAEQIGEQSWVLRGFALPQIDQLLPALEAIIACAPLRHMMTPGGFSMSVATSSCGALGWITDRSGYRYSSEDPVNHQPWPAMPEVFRELAREAAKRAGFADFEPDSCLINRYVTGAKMSLHQDKDENAYEAPIVSLSLGLPATFLFGGFARGDRSQKISLLHGDMVIWGGVDRLRYHGILPIKPGRHPRLGEQRFNLTFRTAG